MIVAFGGRALSFLDPITLDKRNSDRATRCVGDSGWRVSVLVFCSILQLATTSVAAAQEPDARPPTIELQGWQIADRSPDGTTVLYKLPVSTSPAGYKRIWERWEYSKEMTDVSPPYRSDLQFIEVDCGGRRMRALQRNTFFRNNLLGDPGWSFSGLGDWSFVPPDTLAEAMLEIACGTNPHGIEQQLSGLPPISLTQINDAAAELHQEVSAHGMAGAIEYSANCFAEVHRRPVWSKVQFCVAFDDAAGAVDAGMAKLIGSPPFTYFDRPHRDSRARTVLDRFAGSPAHSQELISLIYQHAVEAVNQSF